MIKEAFPLFVLEYAIAPLLSATLILVAIRKLRESIIEKNLKSVKQRNSLTWQKDLQLLSSLPTL